MSVLRLLLLSLLLIAAPRHTAAQEAEVPLVYAAASLTDVLQQIAADYSRERQRSVRLSFGSTATLARQIEAGARADLFVAADEDWMDYVEQRGLVRRGSRLPLLGNSLVLIAPASSTTRLSLQRGVDLGAALGRRGRLALADPASVPAGKYAKAALSSLGAWQSVESRIVAGDNVRMALLYVARGEAPLGVVYATDAQAEPRVRVVAQFPRESHLPIVYPAALTTQALPGTDAFLEYLAGSTARARFEAAGFVVLADARAPSLACRVGERDMDTEIRLFQGEARPVTAAKSARAALPELAPGTLWALALTPQQQLEFAAPPSRSLLPDGAWGGMAQFRVAQSGRHRITVDGPFWIDVIHRGKPLTTVDFGGRQECPLFRKSVEYELPANEPLTLQLNGAGRDQVRVTIVPVAAPATPAAPRAPAKPTTATTPTTSVTPATPAAPATLATPATSTAPTPLPRSATPIPPPTP